jgi:hypothetical protein
VTFSFVEVEIILEFWVLSLVLSPATRLPPMMFKEAILPWYEKPRNGFDCLSKIGNGIVIGRKPP